MDEFIIQLLVKKITTGDINPKSGNPYKLEDIKKEDYKNAVKNILTNMGCI